MACFSGTARDFPHLYHNQNHKQTTEGNSEEHSMPFRPHPTIPSSCSSPTQSTWWGDSWGGAHKWKRNGWRCSTGEAQHADLWNKILPLVDTFGPNLQVLHVPSHCSIPGNEKADCLADQGLRNRPLLASPPKARRFALVDIEIDSDDSSDTSYEPDTPPPAHATTQTSHPRPPR